VIFPERYDIIEQRATVLLRQINEAGAHGILWLG
jgi:hypothetical protein